MFELDNFLQISHIFTQVLFIAPRSDSTYEKIKSNIQEVLARRGAVLIITEEDNPDFKDIEYVFRVPSTLEYLFTILAVRTVVSEEIYFTQTHASIAGTTTSTSFHAHCQDAFFECGPSRKWSST